MNPQFQLSPLLVHRPEKGPSSEAESYFFGSGGSLRKRGWGGGGGRGSRGSRGGEPGRRHGRLARQQLLEHRVHLTADHVLRGREGGRRGGRQTVSGRHMEDIKLLYSQLSPHNTRCERAHHVMWRWNDLRPQNIQTYKHHFHYWFNCAIYFHAKHSNCFCFCFLHGSL